MKLFSVIHSLARIESHFQYSESVETFLEGFVFRNGVNEFSALLRLTSGEPYTVAELFGGV